MAINRRFLYAGLFLVALGGVVVAVELSAVDTSTITSALRLWPLAFIAIGAGIALRRSRVALVAGMLAAMIPGIALGGFAALAPRHGLDCGTPGAAAETATQRGTAPLLVELDANCGSVSIGTQPGNTWQLTTSSVAGHAPDVEQSGDRLSISSTGADWDWLDGGRDSWNLTLPTTVLEHVAVSVNAGRVVAALPGANIGSLVLDGNAADIVVDASSATIHEINGSVDFGRLALQLPAGSTYSGAFRLGGGDLRLCIPYGLGVRVELAGTPREVRVNGLRTDASSWQNDLYLQSPTTAELSVKVNFGSVAINPIGGCK